VTQFRENQHDWGGEGFPVAVDARTGVEVAVAAHAAVDRVQSGHQPAAAVSASRVEDIGLPQKAFISVLPLVPGFPDHFGDL
jgi:hypothetical protein